jgi:hypothetical protein
MIKSQYAVNIVLTAGRLETDPDAAPHSYEGTGRPRVNNGPSADV